jgi:hypothetical protein
MAAMLLVSGAGALLQPSRGKVRFWFGTAQGGG